MAEVLLELIETTAADQFTKTDWVLLALGVLVSWAWAWFQLFIDEARQDAEDRGGIE